MTYTIQLNPGDVLPLPFTAPPDTGGGGEGGGGGTGGGTWGTITGTLADQTDLQTALDGKASTSHVHASGVITVDASGFAGNLSETDIDVQTALATLDALTIGVGLDNVSDIAGGVKVHTGDGTTSGTVQAGSFSAAGTAATTIGNATGGVTSPGQLSFPDATATRTTTLNIGNGIAGGGSNHKYIAWDTNWGQTYFSSWGTRTTIAGPGAALVAVENLAASSNKFIGFASGSSYTQAVDTRIQRLAAGALGVYQSDGTTLGTVHVATLTNGTTGVTTIGNATGGVILPGNISWGSLNQQRLNAGSWQSYESSLTAWQTGIQQQASATGVTLGFFGATPIVPPDVDASSATLAADLHAALLALGLIVDSAGGGAVIPPP